MGIEIFNTGVYLSLPPAHLFTLFPNPEPRALPPPPLTEDWTLKSPIAIDPTWFNYLLEPMVPITFSLVYFGVVTIWNQVNRRRGWKPYGISKTSAFKYFTLTHNIVLAIYSAFTFVGMCRALWVSTPGWFGSAPVAHQIDALCKMQGPRGFGDAVAYDPAGAKWTVKNQAIRLGVGELAPDPTDVGRIWNEGLAFWGWLFYLSKFYEVVDTLILLLKGKRATTLQTYHHFGAMFAMWSGMRYMSAPIWMFVMINSFIHTLMYTFYALSVVGRKVHPRLKQTLTTLQITQFVLGIFYASAHQFISYDVPTSLPYQAMSLLSHPKEAVNAASDFWSSAVETGRSSGTLPGWAKRIIYRAVGAEGLAESVRDGHIFTDRFAHSQHDKNQHAFDFGSSGDRHLRHAATETVRCIDTEGQTFAIWLNVAYLMPLMGLFIRFFVKSYLRKDKQAGQGKGQRRPSRRFSDHVEEAARRTSDVVEGLGTHTEEAVEDAAEEVEKTAEATSEKVEYEFKEESSSTRTTASRVSESIQRTEEEMSETIQRKSSEVKKTMKDSNMGDSYVEVIEKMRQGAVQAATPKKGDAPNDTFNINSSSSSHNLEDDVAAHPDDVFKDEMHDSMDNSNILNRKNSDPSMAGKAATKQGSKKSKK